jgi:hypothetical protein
MYSKTMVQCACGKGIRNAVAFASEIINVLYYSRAGRKFAPLGVISPYFSDFGANGAGIDGIPHFAKFHSLERGT